MAWSFSRRAEKITAEHKKQRHVEQVDKIAARKARMPHDHQHDADAAHGIQHGVARFRHTTHPICSKIPTVYRKSRVAASRATGKTKCARQNKSAAPKGRRVGSVAGSQPLWQVLTAPVWRGTGGTGSGSSACSRVPRCRWRLPPRASTLRPAGRSARRSRRTAGGRGGWG